MENNVTIIKNEILSEKKFTLRNYTYQLTENGNTTDKKAEVYYRPDAVAVLLYNNEQQTILLTQQFRLPAYLNGTESGYMTEVCAGLIDEGEAPAETARREVKEETGYDVESVEEVALAYSSVGGLTERVHLFVAAYNPGMKTSEGGGLEEESESVSLLELPITKAKELLSNKEFTDMKTILLLQYYFLNIA